MDEVTGFVADVRARSERVRDSLDPQTAERVVVSAFTSDDLDDLDAGELTRTKMMLLAAIVAGQHLDDAGLDEFIAKARALADAAELRPDPAMPVTDEQVMALRAFLAFDPSYQHLAGELR
jgi:hypothetical protein